jgi:hypothetical protein
MTKTNARNARGKNSPTRKPRLKFQWSQEFLMNMIIFSVPWQMTFQVFFLFSNCDFVGAMAGDVYVRILIEKHKVF